MNDLNNVDCTKDYNNSIHSISRIVFWTSAWYRHIYIPAILVLDGICKLMRVLWQMHCLLTDYNGNELNFSMWHVSRTYHDAFLLYILAVTTFCTPSPELGTKVVEKS